jgi:O-antigen/teichoic acid export membrane protein
MSIVKKIQQKVSLLPIDSSYYIKSCLHIISSYGLLVIKGIFTTYIIARFLPIEQFGIYKFGLAAFNIIGVFSILGMAVSITKSIKNTPIEFVPIKHSIKQHALVSLAGAFVLLLLIPILFFYNRENLWPIIIAMTAIYIPYYVSFAFFKGIVWAKEKTDYLYKIELAETIVLIPPVLLLLYYTKSAFWLIVPMLYIPTIIRFLFLKKLLKSYPSNKKSNTIINYGFKISLYALPLMFVGTFDDIIVSSIFGLEQLALFSVAFIIPDALNTFSGMLLQATQARQSTGADSKEVRKFLHRAILYLMPAFIIGTVVYIYITPLILPILFPNYPLQIVKMSQFAILVCLLTPLLLCKQYLDGKGLIQKLRTAQLTSVIIGLFSLAILSYLYKTNGVIFARIIFTYCYLGLCFYYTMPRSYSSLK